MRLIIVLTVLILSYRIKCTDLLAYGPTAGDSTGPTEDKGSVSVSLDPGFPFYGQTYSNLFVNDDAVISFNSKLNKVDLQDSWPLGSNKAVVCLYCADVDVTKGGNIYYQLRTDSTSKSVIADDLKMYTEIPEEFEPAWVFVGTWLNVKSYANNDDEGTGNTFQVVMATNGSISVVMFLYDTITWAIDIERIPGYGDMQDDVRTVVGFNAGDGTRHNIHSSSYTNKLLDLPTINNSKGESGKIIYRVDTDVILVDTLREVTTEEATTTTEEASTTTLTYGTTASELSSFTIEETTSSGTKAENGVTSGTTTSETDVSSLTAMTSKITETSERITSETTLTLGTTTLGTTTASETTTVTSETTMTSETTTVTSLTSVVTEATSLETEATSLETEATSLDTTQTRANYLTTIETSPEDETLIKNNNNSLSLTTSQYVAIGVSSAALVLISAGIIVFVKIKSSSPSFRKPIHVTPAIPAIHSNGHSKPYYRFQIPRPQVRNRVDVF